MHVSSVKKYLCYPVVNYSSEFLLIKKMLGDFFCATWYRIYMQQEKCKKLVKFKTHAETENVIPVIIILVKDSTLTNFSVCLC